MCMPVGVDSEKMEKQHDLVLCEHLSQGRVAFRFRKKFLKNERQPVIKLQVSVCLVAHN